MSTALENENKEMVKRMKYTKELVNIMLTKKEKNPLQQGESGIINNNNSSSRVEKENTKPLGRTMSQPKSLPPMPPGKSPVIMTPAAKYLLPPRPSTAQTSPVINKKGT